MCGAWLRRKVPQSGQTGRLSWPLGNGRLRDRKAEPEQFALNPRRTPKHILNAHLPDQCPQTRIDWWPASQVVGYPAPIAAKACAMPSHQRLGSNGRHRLHDRWKPPIQLKEEQAIAVRELDPTAYLSLHHNQLLPQRGALCFKSALGLEDRATQAQEEKSVAIPSAELSA